MAVTLFTKHAPGISGRLRFLGRAFQWYGVVIGTLNLIYVIMVLTYPKQELPLGVRDARPTEFFFAALRAASLIIIGKALHKRLRWGAYLAVVTIIGPFARQWTSTTPRPVASTDILIGIVLLWLLISVRQELRSVRDADFSIESTDAHLDA